MELEELATGRVPYAIWSMERAFVGKDQGSA